MRESLWDSSGHNTYTHCHQLPPILAYKLAYGLEEEAAGVSITERVVEYIAVTVQVLAVVRGLYVGIGLQESSQSAVVDATVHVDDAGMVDHLVPGKASGSDVAQDAKHAAHELVRPAFSVTAFSPGSKRHRLRDLACHAVVIAFGDGVDAANVVFVGVA